MDNVSLNAEMIETLYKGCFFHNLTEARWAVFFDALGIKWSYKVEEHNLSDGIYYLSAVSDWPAAVCALNSCFFKVKGKSSTIEEQRKACYLAKQSGHPVVLASGTPGVERMSVWFAQNGDRHERCEWAVCEYNRHVGIKYIDDCVLLIGDCDHGDCCIAIDEISEPIEAAYTAARSARFGT